MNITSNPTETITKSYIGTLIETTTIMTTPVLKPTLGIPARLTVVNLTRGPRIINGLKIHRHMALVTRPLIAEVTQDPEEITAIAVVTAILMAGLDLGTDRVLITIVHKTLIQTRRIQCPRHNFVHC